MVSQQDRDEMQKILDAFSGKSNSKLVEHANTSVELVGPGQVTQKDVAAMADVLKKLNDVTSQVITESGSDPQLSEAVQTSKTQHGVNVGRYRIMIKEDAQRLAGKQYYSIYLGQTNNIIADDITLYEVALAIVKNLNGGKFVNSTTVRQLFEIDNRYTSYRTDAIRFKRRLKTANKTGDYTKSEIYESRYKYSVSQAIQAKKEIKTLILESRISK